MVCYVVIVLLDDGLVEADGVLVLVVILHEEHVADVEAPHVMIAAELDRLAEDFLDGGVVLHLPVDARLGHQYGYVALQVLVVLLQ